jgi:hypothetical protein
MLRVTSLVGVVVGTALLSSPAAAVVACVGGSVASYVALGSGGCSVGPVTFSNISVETLFSNGGSVVLGNFTPISFGNDYGLTLHYLAIAPGANATADVFWNYNVSGDPFLHDAFLAFAGNTSGSGHAEVSEILSNGTVLSLNVPGSTTAEFSPITTLFVLKNQANFVGASGGTAQTSALTNAFSVGVVPLPAALPLFASGLAALGLLGRRKKRKALASSGAAA